MSLIISRDNVPVSITSETAQDSVSKSKKAIHFPGLNAFRFLAAALVVLVHLEDARQHLDVTAFSLHLPAEVGGFAVTFFFVLSGFLITFLLLHEKQVYNTIAIGKFYWRRVLRIWPLYYLVVFIAFALLNNMTFFPAIADKAVYQNAPTNLLLYLLLLPNIAWIIGQQIVYANQLWSVGVEEQFYLLWPLLIKYVGRRAQLWFMIGLVISFIAVRNSAAFLLHYPIYNPMPVGVPEFVNSFFTVTRISCMAIGGLGAYAFYFHKPFTEKVISSTAVDILVVGLVLLLSVTKTYIPYVMYEALSVLFCYIILSCSCKKKPILKLENRVWKWLGNLSYGIYMWHMIVLGLFLQLIHTGIVTSSIATDTLLYVGVLPCTILLSWLSYRYIEKPFLRFKKSFVVIASKA